MSCLQNAHAGAPKLGSPPGPVAPVPVVTPADLARVVATLDTADYLEVTAPDVRTLLTLEQARALPGMLGRIAPPVLKQHGYYSYTEMPSGRKILLELEQNPGIRGGAHE